MNYRHGAHTSQKDSGQSSSFAGCVKICFPKRSISQQHGPILLENGSLFVSIDRQWLARVCPCAWASVREFVSNAQSSKHKRFPGQQHFCEIKNRPRSFPINYALVFNFLIRAVCGAPLFRLVRYFWVNVFSIPCDRTLGMWTTITVCVCVRSYWR